MGADRAGRGEVGAECAGGGAITGGAKHCLQCACVKAATALLSGYWPLPSCAVDSGTVAAGRELGGGAGAERAGGGADAAAAGRGGQCAMEGGSGVLGARVRGRALHHRRPAAALCGALPGLLKPSRVLV